MRLAATPCGQGVWSHTRWSEVDVIRPWARTLARLRRRLVSLRRDGWPVLYFDGGHIKARHRDRHRRPDVPPRLPAQPPQWEIDQLDRFTRRPRDDED